MEQRICAGYVITQSIQVKDTEFVLGEHPKTGMCATWQCKNTNCGYGVVDHAHASYLFNRFPPWLITDSACLVTRMYGDSDDSTCLNRTLQ